MNVCNRTCASRKSETNRPILRTQRSSCAWQFLPTCADRESHRRAQFFQVLAHFVHSDATLFGRVLAQVKSRVDLFGKNALESFRQGFAQFQTEAHGVC